MSTVNNFRDSLEQQVENKRIASQKRAEIEASYKGGAEGYLKDVIIEFVDPRDNRFLSADKKAERAADPKKMEQTLRQFYGVFERCFPIDEEREALGIPTPEDNEACGFWKILTQVNDSKEMEEKIGKNREFLMVLRDPITKEVIGGMDFSVYLHKNDLLKPGEVPTPPTVHMTYTFLSPEYRDLGLARLLMDAMDNVTVKYALEQDPKSLQATKSILVFSEQNIPEKMGPLSYAVDSSQAIDQVTRLQKWGHLGFARMVMPYVQPANEPGGDPCDVLSLNVYKRDIELGKDGSFKCGERKDPQLVDALHVYNDLFAFYHQNIGKRLDMLDPITGDEDGKRIISYLGAKVANGERIRTVSKEKNALYLDRCKKQAEFVQRRLGDTPLDDERFENRTMLGLYLDERVGKKISPARDFNNGMVYSSKPGMKFNLGA